MTKTQIITFKYRLEPNKAQEQKFVQFVGSGRFVFNRMLNRVKEAASNKIYLTFVDLANELPVLKREHPWLAEAPSQVLQQATKDLYNGVISFGRQRKKGKEYGFPSYRKKYIHDSMKFPQHVKVKDNWVWLSKIGWVRFRKSREIEGTIKQAVVKRRNDHWYVSLTCTLEKEVPEVVIKESHVVGLDVGLLNFATLSSGDVIPNPKFLKTLLKQVKHLQKLLSKAKKGGQNRLKLKKKLNKLHEHIRNARDDFLHKITTYLVKNYDAIVIEGLNVRGMVKNRCLSFAISDVAWSKFFSLLSYKCEWAGKKLIVIDRFFPSSKMCSSCTALQDMPLKQRTYKCSQCNLVMDRDLNAAKNIKKAGLSFLEKACGG